VKMKKELDECLGSAQILNQTGDYNSSNCDSLIAKYKSTGIRHEKMERFETLVNHFREIVDMSSIVSRSNYLKFSKICEEFQEISKIQSVRQIRESTFHKMYSSYMETKQKLN